MGCNSIIYAKRPLGFRRGHFQQPAGNQRVARQAVALLLLLAACRPASYEQFIRADQATDGEYVFALDLSDSAAVYDLSFYTRIDPALMAVEQPDRSLGLEVSWSPAVPLTVTPDSTAVMPDADRASLPGPALRETVYIPYGGKAGSLQLYRSGVRPSPAGEWRVAVRPQAAPEGLRGIGIIYKRHD